MHVLPIVLLARRPDSLSVCPVSRLELVRMVYEAPLQLQSTGMCQDFRCQGAVGLVNPVARALVSVGRHISRGGVSRTGILGNGRPANHSSGKGGLRPSIKAILLFLG